MDKSHGHQGQPPFVALQDLPPRGSSQSLTTTLLVNNIHCASCVAYAKDVLLVLPHVRDVDISVVAHSVRVRHGPQTQTSVIVKAMLDAAFEVFHASTQDAAGRKINDMDTSSWANSTTSRIGSVRWSSASIGALEERLKSRKRVHLGYCEACKWGKSDGMDCSSGEKDLEKDGLAPILSNAQPQPMLTDDKLQEQQLRTPAAPKADPKQGQDGDEYDAQVGVFGMTCAACVNTVTAGLEELDCVKSVTVNLLTNNAVLTFRGPRSNIDLIIDQIEDMGFEGTVDEITHRPRARDLHVTNVSITGMTCASCAQTITRSVEELPFVTNVVVDLLGNSGRVEFEGQENLDKITDKIDDIGFEAAVVDCASLASDGGEDDDSPKSRTVGIKVDGMFCNNCPQTVLNSLSPIVDQTGVVIDEAPTTQKPIVTVTYTPAPPSLTIRNLIAAIDSANDAFKASVYHPPSIEERSRAMQAHERKRLLCRLLFVFLAAIPTFIVGIVFMALVPKTNSVRLYLEESMWVGSVSRMEWALLIMTTPVMFYGTDVFHVRALKEIRSLWRPGSRVPILRRFYRFGSMNMLISAGTSVAYFSSLAVLIMGSQNQSHGSEHTPTYFDTIVFLTLFILAGRALEAYSKAKTGDAVAMLGQLRPSEAYLVVEAPPTNGPGDCSSGSNSNIQKIPVDLLEVGDTVNVPHGASPPADGLVTGTDSSYKFDESSLTGESMPVSKVAEDKVYSGSVNVGQPVSIRITDLGSTSMLDQIVAVVREGQAKRAPVERLADLVTGYFVPVITLIAILTFVVWLSLGSSGVLPPEYMDQGKQGGWAFWSLKFAIAVFVVACPCGLALAAPTALFVGGGLAAKRGILVRGGGEAFQEASRLGAIVFDKTGTLTEGGTLRVSDHKILIQDAELRKVAWALGRTLEQSSTHPIAQAIARFCGEHESSSSVLSSTVTEIGGQGMKGTFTVSGGTDGGEEEEETTYEAAIGNQRLLESVIAQGTDTSYLNRLLSSYQSAGRSTAILSVRKVSESSSEAFIPAIVFATADPIRPEAPQVIADLRSRKIEVYMCTGDNSVTAHAVASSLGIPTSNVMANVLPNQKADYIRSVQDGTLHGDIEPPGRNGTNPSRRTIAGFVGDGTNDSPALAAADASIAMASGSDVAVNSAGFILLNSDLRTILQLCILSRRVFQRVKLNFFWAAVYNLCLVPVAAGVFYPIVSGYKVNDDDGSMTAQHWRLDPVWAALAMALSSVSVVSSSLALRIELRAVVPWVRGKFGKFLGKRSVSASRASVDEK